MNYKTMLGAAWVSTALIASPVTAHKLDEYDVPLNDGSLVMPPANPDFVDTFSPPIKAKPQIIPPGETRFFPNGETFSVECDPTVPNMIFEYDPETGIYITCPDSEDQSNDEPFLGM